LLILLARSPLLY